MSSFIDDFADMMPSDVTVAPFVSRTGYGAGTWGTPVTYKAHISNKSTLIRGPTGEMIVAKGTIWLSTSNTISTKDKVTLPDGSTPLILDSNGAQDETGDTVYVRLDFG